MADKKPTYWELLKHPKWQKKRLEILQRENFSCEQCKSTDNTLHVHHAYYERGLKPWEYPSDSLHCLCENCHEFAQDWMSAVQREIGLLPLYRVETLYGFLRALAWYDGKDEADRPIAATWAVCQGVAFVLSTNAGFVSELARDGSIDMNALLKAVFDYHASKIPKAGDA